MQPDNEGRSSAWQERRADQQEGCEISYGRLALCMYSRGNPIQKGAAVDTAFRALSGNLDASNIGYTRAHALSSEYAYESDSPRKDAQERCTGKLGRS